MKNKRYQPHIEKLGMVVHAFLAALGKQGQVGLHKSEVNLDYVLRSSLKEGRK